MLAAVVLSGCAFDGAKRLDRPARFQVGVNSRQLAQPEGDGFAARSTQPTSQSGLVADHATTFDAQFTMAPRQERAREYSIHRPNVSRTAPMTRSTISPPASAPW